MPTTGTATVLPILWTKMYISEVRGSYTVITGCQIFCYETIALNKEFILERDSLAMFLFEGESGKWAYSGPQARLKVYISEI